ncbi:MAG TPA: NupC/NupG family nucleoside CNT transporter [Armatimonadetes bacterium]|nr:NupC/NupG family nucleoside CNT transporter [Armatimonadota bacterium]
MQRVISFFGLFVMMGLAFLFCPRKQRQALELRVVLGGLGLQLLFALLILKTPARILFDWADTAIKTLLGFADQGAQFLFGQLATDVQGYGLAVKIGGSIVFFSSLMAVLYYLGVMQVIVSLMARVMAKLMGTSGAESLSAAANIFVGMTEAPLMIRPFVSLLTESELFAVMTAGLATVAGGVMAFYVSILQDKVPGIAGHLLTASVMSAPAALVIAKLMQPETGEPVTRGEVKVQLERLDVNLIDAAARGAAEGLKLAANVAAMLLAFIALVKMVNAGLGLVGLSLEQIFGWVFAPLAWVMGVPSEDVTTVANLLGIKTVVNEAVAYTELAKLLADPTVHLHPRSLLIASYALCGFANFGSIAILIGGVGGMAPERRSDLSRLGLKSLIGGSLAAFMTACIAGLLG